MDFSKNISENIKKLRESQHLTQEQLANSLGISYQAVSKWENAVTTPDVMMLPQIAQVFGVSIDDLFKAQMDAYENEAERWLAIYESSHNQDDFIRADIEFKKLFESNKYNDKDIRKYGVLYEYHMHYCRDKALEQYDKIISEGKKDDTYYGACSQKNLLLSSIGRGEEQISYWEDRIKEEDSSLKDYICLVCACHWAKQYDKAAGYFERAESVYGEEAKNNYSLYIYGGDTYRALKKYDEAFKCWRKALDINDYYMDAWFSMGFSYADLGDYVNAAEIWKKVIDMLTGRGCIYEAKWPRELLRNAESKIGDQKK